MAYQPNGPHAMDYSGDYPGVNALNLSHAELEIAMDMITQIVPQLDLKDCHKVAELAQAQATLLEIMNSGQSISPEAIRRHFAA